jgi:hypothetical protein
VSGISNYVVLRPAPCISEEDRVPSELFGQFLDLAEIPKAAPDMEPRACVGGVIGTHAVTPEGFHDYQARASNTFEQHEVTGVVAEIYLVHGVIHNCVQVCG